MPKKIHPDRRALCNCPTCIAGWKEIAAYNRAKEWEKRQLQKRVQNPRVMAAGSGRRV